MSDYSSRISRRMSRFDPLDARISRWMHQRGHRLDRLAIGLAFMWFGTLKVAGFESATSIIAKTVYLGSPEVMSRVLGAWELAIGVCLVVRPLARAAVALLLVRLPGTFLALIMQPDVCWTDSFGVPTVQGQYLVKDLILFTAAMIIGGTVRDENVGDGVRR